MNLVVLTAILLGFGVPVEEPAGRAIGYEVKIFEMESLDWRGTLHAQLVPVARPGIATVWSAPRDTKSTIAAASTRTVYAPRPVQEGGISGSVRQTLKRPYVADVVRMADGPVNQATALAFNPVIDHWEETLAVGVACEKLESGVVAAVEIDESRVISISSYEIKESVRSKDPNAKPGQSELTARVQVPELAADHVRGKWLVPNGHLLVISLGAHTIKQADGKTIVTERVAVIDPDENTSPTHAIPATVDPAATLASLGQATAIAGRSAGPLPPLPIGESGRWEQAAPTGNLRTAGNAPVVIQTGQGGAVVIILPNQGGNTVEPAAQLALARPVSAPSAPSPAVTPPVAAAAVPAIPALPSRSMPVARNQNGEEVPLPDTTEPDQVEDDTSAEPHASPQTRGLNPAPVSPHDETHDLPGPGAESHPPTYQSFGRTLKVTGVYRDGQGWSARENQAGEIAAGSVGVRLRIQLRASNPGQPGAAGKTQVLYEKELAGTFRCPNASERSTAAPAPGEPAEQCNPLEIEITAERPEACPGSSLAALRKIAGQVALGCLEGDDSGDEHSLEPAAEPTPAASSEVAPIDSKVSQASASSAAASPAATRSFGLVFGSGAPHAARGRLDGTHVIRVPVFGLWSILYRDDMAAPAAPGPN